MSSVLPLADTSVWSRLADGILLVAREGTNRKRELQRGIDTLDRSKLQGLGSDSTDQSNYYQRYGPTQSTAQAKTE